MEGTGGSLLAITGSIGETEVFRVTLPADK